MDNDKAKEILLNILFFFASWIIIGLAAIAAYFLYYNPELLKQFLAILVVAAFYGWGLIFAFWFRKRKAERLKKVGQDEATIYLTQFDLFKHDVLIFGTPLLMLGIIYLINNEVTGADLINSVVAFIGLYLTSLIYKKKINY